MFFSKLILDMYSLVCFEMQCACVPNVGDGVDAAVFYLKAKQRLWSQGLGEDSSSCGKT